MMPRLVWNRVYADFLMPSRLAAFRSLLEEALDAGYIVESIRAFWERLCRGDAPPARCLVLRHDVDTDPATAAAMWRVGTSLGIQGSFFFRLSTVDVQLMRAIDQAGGDVGYHYEELATIAKRRRVHDRETLLTHLPESRDRFRVNLGRLRDATGLRLGIAAAHGDFVNRRLLLTNSALLDDERFRSDIGIDLEVYDASFMRHVTSRHADTGYPRFWMTGDPIEAMARREPVIYLLVHPRHWRVARAVNLRDDARRLADGVSYALPIGDDRRAAR